MGIFLLCIPLVIFIAAEGFIIYELIKIIADALTEYGFADSTIVGNVYHSGTAMLLVSGLVIVVGVMIWVYIRFAVISTVRNKNKAIHVKANEKPQNAVSNDIGYGSDGDYIDYMEYMDSIDDTKLENYANTRKKSKIKAKKNKKNKKIKSNYDKNLFVN